MRWRAERVDASTAWRDEEEIPAALDGERLDRIVALLADVTRSVAADLIAGGWVRVDGQVAAVGKVRLRAGQRVLVDRAGIPVPALPAADPQIDVPVVYEDDDLVVVDKPAGLVVHPGAGNPQGTLVNGLLARYPEIAGVGDPSRPGIVHRLDAGTSGLLVVARSPQAYAALVDALAARQVQRVYLALAWGRPEADAGVIDAPIGRDPRDPTRMAVVTGGRAARTRFEVLEVFDAPQTTLLRCTLETGRTHQIRVHLASIGHPVVADAVYGGSRPGLPLTRPFLHAASLAFVQPRTGVALHVDSALPDDLAGVLASLSGRGPG
jgi:23S rRNA pseudouridine1911/1915/1917 synthase